jgi:hypothetical protein
MKSVVYYYNSVIGEHKNDRGNTVANSIPSRQLMLRS